MKLRSIVTAAFLLASLVAAGADPREDGRLAAAEQARGRAEAAEAARLAPATWTEAEEKLQDAARRLEDGDADRALERAAEAQKLYDAAELQAIKAALLTEARREVVAVGREGAARLAPRTAARAGELLRQAEAELDADRGRRDAARRLAAEAAAEARNALSMAALLRAARESDETAEDMLLEWEASLARAAAAAGGVADFSGGPLGATDELVGEIAALRARSDQQAEDLAQRDRQIGALEEEIRELDERLAGASNEARSATLRLEARERAREQLGQLERLFEPEQALVLRRDGNLIVRVRGLGFAPGSARLPAAADALMTALVKAVALYPSAPIAVEGHTDTSGDSATNQRLSQARAEAVRDQLTQRLQVPPGQVTAIGYGDTRPVASNDDAAGRRENRRIDLVITPPAEALP